MASLGFTAKVLINTLPLDIIGDVVIEGTWSEVEVKNRKSRKVKFLRALLTEAIDLTIENNKEDAAFQAIKAANATETPIKVTIKEDDTDTDPYVEEFIVTKFSKSYPLEDKRVVDVSFRPSGYPTATP